jgi:peptide/nickel transport system permease protein
MLGYALRRSRHAVLGIAGAAVAAACLAALTDSHAGAASFAHAVLMRLAGAFRLDLGASLISGRPVAAELAARLPVTLELAAAGGILALAIGVPLGLMSRAATLRRASAPVLQAISAMPVFCAGLALVFIASAAWGWRFSGATAGGGFFTLDANAWRAAALPVVTAGLAGAAAVQLSLRRAALRAATEPFRSEMKWQGIGALEIEGVYLLPRTLAGLLAAAGEIALTLLSAVAVTERLFLRAGAADLFMSSVALGDWGVASPILFVFAAIAISAEWLGRMAAYALIREELP